MTNDLNTIPASVRDAEETSGEFLKRLGMDGMLWSIEMHKRFPQVPQDDLLDWCCSMIMAGYDESQRRICQPNIVIVDLDDGFPAWQLFGMSVEEIARMKDWWNGGNPKPFNQFYQEVFDAGKTAALAALKEKP